MEACIYQRLTAGVNNLVFELFFISSGTSVRDKITSNEKARSVLTATHYTTHGCGDKPFVDREIREDGRQNLFYYIEAFERIRHGA